MIYTILVGIICLSIMMYIFDNQMAEVKYSTSAKRCVLKEDNYQKNKEYLLTLFSTYMDDHKEEIRIEKDGTIKFFCDFTGDIVKYETSTVGYSKTTNEIIFTTPDEYRTTRNDYFKLEVVGESFEMIFVRTEYNYKVGGKK